MTKKQVLADSYALTRYKLANNGPRNVEVLKTAFQSVEGSIASDMYGEGEIIEEFQKKMSDILGKEAAVFFPSGTMAQQIALRIWTDKKQNPTVAYHPLAHLEIHEQSGLKEFHHVQTILLGDKKRLLRLEDIQSLDKKPACVLLELPQREIGGQLPAFEELQGIADYCHEKGIILHLDGARLWETLPYYQKSAAEVCALFDSVYVSFYKGLGGIAGAILAGPKDFMEQSKIWKRRYGGDLISLYPYIVSADYSYEKRINNMPEYYAGAVQLAKRFNQCPGVRTIPEIPVTNMFHVHFDQPAETVEEILATVNEQTNVGIAGALRPNEDGEVYFELSVGDLLSEIPEEVLDNAFACLQAEMKSHVD